MFGGLRLPKCPSKWLCLWLDPLTFTNPRSALCSADFISPEGFHLVNAQTGLWTVSSIKGRELYLSTYVPTVCANSWPSSALLFGFVLALESLFPSTDGFAGPGSCLVLNPKALVHFLHSDDFGWRYHVALGPTSFPTLLINALTGKVRTEPRWSPFQSALDRCSRPRKRYATPSDKINAPPIATSTKSLRGMNRGKRWEL